MVLIRPGNVFPNITSVKSFVSPLGYPSNQRIESTFVSKSAIVVVRPRNNRLQFPFLNNVHSVTPITRYSEADAFGTNRLVGVGKGIRMYFFDLRSRHCHLLSYFTFFMALSRSKLEESSRACFQPLVEFVRQLDMICHTCDPRYRPALNRSWSQCDGFLIDASTSFRCAHNVS